MSQPAPPFPIPDQSQIGLEAFGFDLNNREIATLIYIALTILALLLWPKIRGSLGRLVKAAFHPKLTAINLVMSLYVTLCTALLALVGAWEWSNLKTTLLWWITAGFGAVFSASQIKEPKQAIRRQLRDVFTWTAVITFVAEVHSLPLIWELGLLPCIVLVSLMLGIAQVGKEHAILVGPLTWVLSFIGFGFLAFSVGGIIQDPIDFLAWHQLREFAGPLLLSLMFIPFIVGLAAVMIYETQFTSLSFRVQDEALLRYARCRALLVFGLDTDGAQRLTRAIRLMDSPDRAAVDAEIATIKRLKRVEADPPDVDPAAGWSPYRAGRFLESYGLATQDYHRSFNDWWSEAPSVKLTDRAFADRVSYYVSGTEHAATRLRLVVEASYQNDTEAADEAFRVRAQALLAAVQATSPTLSSHLLEGGQECTVVNRLNITVSKTIWGIERLGGYQRSLVVLHPAHVMTLSD